MYIMKKLKKKFILNVIQLILKFLKFQVILEQNGNLQKERMYIHILHYISYIDAELLFYICRLWKIRNFMSRRANEIINFRKNQN